MTFYRPEYFAQKREQISALKAKAGGLLNLISPEARALRRALEPIAVEHLEYTDSQRAAIANAVHQAATAAEDDATYRMANVVAAYDGSLYAVLDGRAYLMPAWQDGDKTGAPLITADGKAIVKWLRDDYWTDERLEAADGDQPLGGIDPNEKFCGVATLWGGPDAWAVIYLSTAGHIALPELGDIVA
ncbi:hypothetical protein V8Z80_08650 [Orrella sp. JC864]|uniref:hypothetical protein n=1 Tax=Orrella sp. JC864 TaxID=3120298 RepID=UPI00300BA278